MGLGKTIQAIGAMHFISSSLKITGPFLVVAPLSTVNQWKREIGEIFFFGVYVTTQNAPLSKNRKMDKLERHRG